ncbi:hypothetical protein DFH09DRAFT_295582 [Mycena vulgaris]|nr:hypothetical protein DFH09DRAFT_295582 [Mycena vulgaris]
MPLGSRPTSATTFLATSCPRLSIGGAISPPSTRRTTNRPPQAGDIVVHHAIPPAGTRHSARARSRNTPRSPTRTRGTRHRPYPLATPLLRRHTSRLFPFTIPPAARRLPHARPGTTCSASRMPRARRGRCSLPAPAPRHLSRSTAAPRSILRCRPLQRDAQHHSQCQRTPSFASATLPRRIKQLSPGIRGTYSPEKT